MKCVACRVFEDNDVFFFSSRRRHTRFDCDWSSDVCSSDLGDKHFDTNGFLIRPAPVGTLSRKVVDAVWLGWNGDGHIGPINVTHAFYQVVGRENRNPINDRAQDISAQMAALEVSTDLDWLRPRASFFWASGDSKPADRVARGFDTIFDNPNFAGGGFSYWVRQGLPLTSTGLELVGQI